MIKKSLLLTASLLVFSSNIMAQTQNDIDIELVTFKYANDIVNEQYCKDVKIQLTVPNQREVISKYILGGGKQENFVNDVRKHASVAQKNLSIFGANDKMQYCQNLKRLDDMIQKNNPEKLAEQRELERKKRENPLDFQ